MFGLDFGQDDEIRDPVGEDSDRERLRGLGKWRFVIRTNFLLIAPVFLYLAVGNLRDTIIEARRLHEPVLPYLLSSWVMMVGMLGFLGCLLGWFAWKRLASDFWPGRPPDPEAEHTRLGL